MKQLSHSTLLKLLMPILYAVLTATYFFICLQQISIQPHHVIGTILVTISFGLWISARVQLGNSFTIGAHAKGLVTTGLYSKLRHPVYYFSILTAMGIAMFTWCIYMTVPVILLIVIEAIRIQKEEQVLTATFGKEYLRYKQTTWF